MKRYANALVLGALLLSGQVAHADMIDDAIGNIQRAIGEAYNTDSRDDRRNDDYQSRDQRRQYDDRYQQLEDRRRQLDDRQRQLDRERRQLDDEQRRLEDDDYR